MWYKTWMTWQDFEITVITPFYDQIIDNATHWVHERFLESEKEKI